MALGTDQPGAEEDLGGVGHIVQGHPGISNIISNCAIIPDKTFGGDHFVDKLIVGLVGLEGFFDPLCIGGARVVPTACLDPQNIAPPIIPMTGVANG